MFVGENCRVVRFSMVKSRFLGTSFERHQTREAATCCDHNQDASLSQGRMTKQHFSKDTPAKRSKAASSPGVSCGGSLFELGSHADFMNGVLVIGGIKYKPWLWNIKTWYDFQKFLAFRLKM